MSSAVTIPIKSPSLPARDISGILIVDKPVGLSSNAVLQRVKRLFRASKAGHGGSLDPLASGVLPVFFGAATRLSTYALDAPKRYVVEATLGARTTTGDAEGEVIARAPVPELGREQLAALLAVRFTGVLQQIPPMYSALKVAGRPLYALARQGVEVERAERAITIYEIQLLRLDGAIVELDVRCSKGTYIRTLVEDIGVALGCGAHVSVLRRSEAGPFTLAESHTLEALQACAEQSGAALDACLLPLSRGVASLPRMIVSEAQADELRHGRVITIAGCSGTVAVFDVAGQLLSIGEHDDAGLLHPRRNFSPPKNGN